jgi:hypothetical protein
MHKHASAVEITADMKQRGARVAREAHIGSVRPRLDEVLREITTFVKCVEGWEQ